MKLSKQTNNLYSTRINRWIKVHYKWGSSASVRLCNAWGKHSCWHPSTRVADTLIILMNTICDHATCNTISTAR